MEILQMSVDFFSNQTLLELKIVYFGLAKSE